MPTIFRFYYKHDMPALHYLNTFVFIVLGYPVFVFFNEITRITPFIYLNTSYFYLMQQYDLNEALMQAVSSYDINAVKYCLKQGADPNYTLFKDEDEPDGLIQPTTPLRLVMFRISDCLLEDADILKFAEIAKVLIQAGANTKPAIQIAEERYGKFDPDYEDSAFMRVWRIIATEAKE
ncbi:MAG: hypothetical protein JXB49_16080 [Bacteroidales bacterium]|nr:hypothetical protein [Bacteroidales bacterium]